MSTRVWLPDLGEWRPAFEQDLAMLEQDAIDASPIALNIRRSYAHQLIVRTSPMRAPHFR